jgi:hypothetical protein
MRRLAEGTEGSYKQQRLFETPESSVRAQWNNKAKLGDQDTILSRGSFAIPDF